MPVPREVEQAIGRGDVDAVRRWIEAGGDLLDVPSTHHYGHDYSTGWWSPLYLACCEPVGHRVSPTRIEYDQEARLELIKLLLENGAGARIHSGCLIFMSSQTDPGGIEHEALRLLLKHTTHPGLGNNGWTALHSAARGFDPEGTAILLDLGHADPNIRILDVERSWPEEEEMNPPYPLMLAASNGISCEVLKVLLSRGADFSAVDLVGQDAEDHARKALELEVWDELPDGDDYGAWDEEWRLAGEVEQMIDVLGGVRAAGSWRRFAIEPRIQVFLLHELCADKRATPPAGVLSRLYALPSELIWKTISFWRTSRDPLY